MPESERRPHRRATGLARHLAALSALGLAVAGAGAPAGARTAPVEPVPAPAPAPAAAAHVAGDPARRAAAMRPILEQAVRLNAAPGFGWAVAGRDGRVATDFVGLADVETGRPMAADTVHRLFSMTKPVTAVAAMILVDEGRLRLDAPVSDYIPAFAGVTVWRSGDTPETIAATPPARPLTVRDVMRLTAGLPYQGDARHRPVSTLHARYGIERSPGEVPEGIERPRVASMAEWADRVAQIPLRHEPGSRWLYGSGIDLLGALVERAAGQSLGAVFETRIFAPLGMRHTGFQVRPGDGERLAGLYASISPRPIADPFLPSIDLDTLVEARLRPLDPPATSIVQRPARLEFGGSGLVGTLDDYMRFARMLAGRGRLDGVRILSEAAFAELSRNQIAPETSDTLFTRGLGYGLGIGIVTDPAKAGGVAPAGTLFWSGAAGTIFWADPGSGEAGVILTQVIGQDIRAFHTAAIRAGTGGH